MAENQNQGSSGVLEPPPPLPVYYMRLNQDNVDARLGKLRRGQVVALDQATATRWAMAGIVDQVSAEEYEDTRERRRNKMAGRQDLYRSLNNQAAMWDVSTYRDVLTASEEGLRAAYAAGLPLVNITMLRDEDGDPLPPDADLDEILEARQWLHADLVAPLAAHNQSSVMGGGSPYQQNFNVGPMPLNPTHRAMAENLARHDAMAQAQPVSLTLPPKEPPAPGRTSRAAQNRARTLTGNQQSGTTGYNVPPVGPPQQQTPPPQQAPAPAQSNVPQSNTEDKGENKK